MSQQATHAGRRAGWRKGPIGHFLQSLWHHAQARIGLIILGFFALIALFAPLIAPYDPQAMLFLPLQPPSAEYLLGTSDTGQDLFSQLVLGTRLTLLVGLAAGFINTFLSVLLGLVSAYVGGRVDRIISLITNVALIIPGLPLIIVVAAYMPISGVFPIILVLCLTGWAWGARVLRSQALSLRNRDFVEAARLSGESTFRVIFSQIFPNMTSLIASNFFGATLYAVLAEASLEFLGLGDINATSWGTMLYWAQNGQALLLGAWWWLLAPGLCIALLGASFVSINYAIDSVTNPRLRRRAPVKRDGRRTGGATRTGVPLPAASGQGGG